MFRAHTVSVGIERTPQEVYAFASDPANLPVWALGLVKDIQQRNGQWIADTALGEARVRFAQANDLGVLDHEVELSSRTFHNAMRVVPNGAGAEVLFTALQFQGVSDEQFAQDLDTIRADLNKLRTVLERRADDAG
jgi:hypothetical protein